MVFRYNKSSDAPKALPPFGNIQHFFAFMYNANVWEIKISYIYGIGNISDIGDILGFVIIITFVYSSLFENDFYFG